MSYVEQASCLENILNSKIELLNKNEVKLILHNKFRCEDLELVNLVKTMCSESSSSEVCRTHLRELLWVEFSQPLWTLI